MARTPSRELIPVVQDGWTPALEGGFIAARNPYLSGGLISANPFRAVLSPLGPSLIAFPAARRYACYDDATKNGDDDVSIDSVAAGNFSISQ